MTFVCIADAETAGFGCESDSACIEFAFVFAFATGIPYVCRTRDMKSVAVGRKLS